jgi:hypothetical protein
LDSEADSGFLSQSSTFPTPATHLVDDHETGLLAHERAYYSDVHTTLESGAGSLPPRYRKQWNKQRELPRNDIRTLTLPNPSGPEAQPNVIDLTQDTDTEVDCVAERLDSDDTGICEDSDSGSDSENNDPPPEPVPFVPAPTEPDVSAMPLDLEHLNASARGVMDTVHASQREIRANPHRSRLPARKEATRHIPNGAHVVSIPKAAYNTARRVLVSESLELPLVTVSMRADIQFFHRTNRWVLCFFFD